MGSGLGGMTNVLWVGVDLVLPRQGTGDGSSTGGLPNGSHGVSGVPEEWLVFTMADRRLVRTRVGGVIAAAKRAAAAVGDDQAGVAASGDESMGMEVVCTQDSPILSWTALAAGEEGIGARWFVGTTMVRFIYLSFFPSIYC